MGQKNSINKNNQDDNASSNYSTTANETDTNENHETKSPAVNANHRVIIRDCFDKASCITAKRILMRINQQRPDFKTYKDNLTPEQIDSLTDLLNEYLSSVIENIDDVEKVKELSMNYGSKHVNLRLIGFKPDFFAALADAIATECSFLSETATIHAPTNTFKAWTLLVDLMFSSVRDGFYQELRRQRRQTSPHLKNSRESSISTEQIVGYSDNNIKLANHRFENDYCNRYDQTIIGRNRFKQSLSVTGDKKRKLSNHRASLLAENILNRQILPTTTTAISNPSFPKSNSANDFITILPATSSAASSFGAMDDNYRNIQMKHINQIDNSINESTINNQLFQNSTTKDNYEANKYQTSRQISSQSSQSTGASKPFDPNQIIDDFMNDRYKV